MNGLAPRCNCAGVSRRSLTWIPYWAVNVRVRYASVISSSLDGLPRYTPAGFRGSGVLVPTATGRAMGSCRTPGVFEQQSLFPVLVFFFFFCFLGAFRREATDCCEAQNLKDRESYVRPLGKSSSATVNTLSIGLTLCSYQDQILITSSKSMALFEWLVGLPRFCPWCTMAPAGHWSSHLRRLAISTFKSPVALKHLPLSCLDFSSTAPSNNTRSASLLQKRMMQWDLSWVNPFLCHLTKTQDKLPSRYIFLAPFAITNSNRYPTIEH